MKINKPIQVFEHKSLLIDEKVFTRSHWEAMDRYNEAHGGRFFTLTSKGVKFNNYVGVIQVGNITIEILPKISQTVEEGDETKWQKILINMLRECRWMRVHAHEKASLRFKPNSILEAYLELFVQECEEIVRMGLVKKYRNIEKNCTALKGKLLFNRQIQLNLIHKERFYTRHQIFDQENIYNQILLKALKVIPVLSHSPFLKDRVYNLLFSFPELEDIKILPATFTNLIFNRKTAHYREAIEVAAMLLLNYRPDINAGLNHVLAILFDMNDLWEEYIYRQLYKCKPANWLIRSQNSKKFWQLKGSSNAKTIRPDIIIHNSVNDSKLVLDTKWKLPENNTPADVDLKQMFVYNEYWQAKNALLIYPNATFTDDPIHFEGIFNKKADTSSTHNCGILKMAVLDEANQTLDSTMGIRMINFLKRQFLTEGEFPQSA